MHYEIIVVSDQISSRTLEFHDLHQVKHSRIQDKHQIEYK